VEIARSGDEEMVLFPSYARRLDIKKKSEKTGTQRRRDSWSETIDEYRGISDESNPTGDSWEDPDLENAVVDVDVRGWIYAPSRGPMSRKHRLMIKLARTLSGIPAPSGATPDDSADRVPSKGEDELVDKQMQTLVDTAEKDADQAWKSSNTDRTRPGTGTGNAIGQAVAMTKDEISMANAHLMERLRPFLTNPMAGMPVTVFFFNDNESESRNLLTDESGHFNLRAAMPFVPTHIRVLASEDLSAAKPIDIIEPVGISLISDIDDTVKHSAIASGAKEMFRNTFVRELAELTVDGVSEWYTQVAKIGVEIHYVSNAPWQLYPLLERYFKQVGLPPGSFHLKQYSGMLQGIFEPTAERKRGSLEQIMRDFPERKFILVGDSGEADLEVYTDIALANPGRILGIFIRDVTTPDKKPFFDQSVGHLEPAPEPIRSRSTPQLFDHSDSLVNRPSLPPRRPLAPPPGVDLKRSNSEDLIDLRDDEPKEKDAAPEIPTATKPRLPPGKPTKPSSLRTASRVGDVSDPVTSNEKSFSQETIRRKPVPPLPPRRLAAKTDSLIDLDTSPPLSRSRTEPFTSEGHQTGPPTRSKAPPPVPPPRRSNTASSTTGSGSSGTSTPRQAASATRSYPAAAGAAAQAALNYATERLNFSTSPGQNLRTSASNQSLSRTSTSYSAAEPLPNKREELWRRRWERASNILEQNGVVLGSWRTGSDAQPVCLWLVEEAMEKIQVNGPQVGAGRRP
jgi:phosphatidate phosphatase APP1